MKIEIKVPAMGESISEATIGSILKPSGSKVAMDDELLELETDKVNQVIFAPQAGIFQLNVAHEDVVKIGQVIGVIDSEEQAVSPKQEPPKKEAAKQEPSKQEPPKKEQPIEKPVEKPISSKQGDQGQIRMGKEAFISEVSKPLEPKSGSQVASAAPDRSEDSKAKQPEKAELPAALAQSGPRETRRKMTKIRKVIASRLVEAQKSTAMLTTFNEVDLSEVMGLREKYKETFAKEHGVKLGFMSFFIKASVAALELIPNVNSYIDGDEIVHREYYDIGVAVGTDRGVIVPVVRNCDQLSFSGIESAIEGFAKKARVGNISVDDLQGGGFTITNGGVYGSLLSTPILNFPQSAILGMHKISKRAVVVNDQIVIRPMMYLALSYDHRIVDGKEAVSFLVHIKNCLEDPSRLLLDI